MHQVSPSRCADINSHISLQKRGMLNPTDPQTSTTWQLLLIPTPPDGVPQVGRPAVQRLVLVTNWIVNCSRTTSGRLRQEDGHGQTMGAAH